MTEDDKWNLFNSNVNEMWHKVVYRESPQDASLVNEGAVVEMY